MEVLLFEKIPKKFNCNHCHYYTSNKKDFDKHLLTLKHQKNINGSILEVMEVKKTPDYICDCNKKFITHSGLWKHKNKCLKKQNINENNKKNDEPSDKELIMMLIKENSELKNMVLDVCQKIQPINNTNITNNTNSHNKSFNLQFFLNETCKDAMNIMDFVDSIKLQLSDLEKVGELGYVDGISNIIVKNLKALDVTQRPVHCTDKKREVLYVKDENKWEKESESKEKIHKVIKKVALKNQRMIPKFKEEHPDCGKSTSKFSDQYNKIIMEAMGGLGNNDKEKEERIIKNISKQVTLDKEII